MKLSLITTIASVCLMASCSGNSKAGSGNKDAADSAMHTAATTEPSAEKPSADEEFVTPDLALADVKGHVKCVYFTNEANEHQNIFEFNDEGRIEHHDYYEFNRLKRDDKGQITGWGYDEYSIEWKDGKPVKFVTRESDGGTSTATYEYNDSGRLVKTTTINDFPGDDGPSTTVTQYTYDNSDIDGHGNWTKRTAGMQSPKSTWTEQRVIIYK